MSLTGAVVNALAIVGGGAIGLLFRRGIPERVSKTVMVGLGLCVLYIGISGASACRSILIVIVSMTLGAAVGALLNIDGSIHRLGTWVEAHVHRHEGGPSLAEGFVTASLLCCIGAMAVNGSLDAGIRGGHRSQSDRCHEDQGGGLSAGAAVRAGHPLARGAAGVAAARRVVLRDTI